MSCIFSGIVGLKFDPHYSKTFESRSGSLELLGRDHGQPLCAVSWDRANSIAFKGSGAWPPQSDQG